MRRGGLSGIRIYSLLILLTNSAWIDSNVEIQTNRNIKNIVGKGGFLIIGAFAKR